MQSPKSVIVDDDVDSQGSLARYVQKQGHRAELSVKCAEAWSRIATSPVDLVVLDVMLRHGPGCDFCRDSGARRSTIPSVNRAVLKGDVRLGASENRADDYFGKPVNECEVQSNCSLRSETGCRCSEGAVADRSGPSVTESDRSEMHRAGAKCNCRLNIGDRPSHARSHGELPHLSRRCHDSALDRLNDALMLPASQAAERRQSENMQRRTIWSALCFVVVALIAAIAIIAVGETVHSQATERPFASQRESRPAR